MKFVGEFRWYCVQNQKNEWFTRVKEHEACERLPMVVPSRAWVDEVKTFKKGDVYVGRGSKQRGLLPSFWANRYKVSKFGETGRSSCMRRKFSKIHNTD